MRDRETLESKAGEVVDKNRGATISDDRLYRLIEGAEYGTHTNKMEIENPGLKTYTFALVWTNQRKVV